MSTSGSFSESVSPILDFVFPPRCPACGAPVARQDGLCATCWSELTIPTDPCCAHCRRPFPVAEGWRSLCAPCLASPPLHDGIVAASIYSASARRLVLAFKHGRKIALAPMLARMMAARMPDRRADRLIVPVPLHRWRLWQRGYNQAALLGAELAKAGHGRMVCDALRRTKPTPSLGGLGRKARARALTGAITVPLGAKPEVRDADILLVDDVLTSGATSDACIRALKRAGARSVVVACFARVADPGVDTVA